MPDFGKLFGKAKEEAGKHSDQVQKGIDKLQDLADKHLDDKYDDQIQQAGDMAEQTLGVDDKDRAGSGDETAREGGDTAPQGSAEPRDDRRQ